MEDEDRYTRITLRIPKDVHVRLQEAADKKSHSMNAEIVSRLKDSFDEMTDMGARVGQLEILLNDLYERVSAEKEAK